MARLPTGVVVSERVTIDPLVREYRFSFPAISPDDVFIAVNGLNVDREAYTIALAAGGEGGVVRFLTPRETTAPFTLRSGQRMEMLRNTEAKDVLSLPAEGFAQNASVETLEERTLRVTEEIVASLTGDIAATVRRYLEDNPPAVPEAVPQVKSDWAETDPMNVRFIDNKPGELSLNSEGPTWLTSALLPTTVLAEEGIIWPWDGTVRLANNMPDSRGPSQWTFGSTDSGNDTGQVIRPNFSPAARVHNSFLSLQPDRIPPDALGIWVIAEQNRNAAGVADSTPAGNWVTEGKVMLPIGPGAGVQDSSGGVSGTEAILVTGYNRTQQHTIEVNYYAWEPLGHVTIALRGDGNAPPANVRLRIAPAGVYGTGLVGPRGPAGPPSGGDGDGPAGVSDYRDLTNKPTISTQGPLWLTTNELSPSWAPGEDMSLISQARWTKAPGSPSEVLTVPGSEDARLPPTPPENTIGLWAICEVDGVERSRAFMPYAGALSSDTPVFLGAGSTNSPTHVLLFASSEFRLTQPDGTRIRESGVSVRVDMNVTEEGGGFRIALRWNRGRRTTRLPNGVVVMPIPLSDRRFPANTRIKVYPATIALMET